MQFANQNNRMFRAPLAPAASFVVVLVLMGMLHPNVALAQVKVAVANPSIIFDEIQEKKDFLAKMNNDLNAFKAERAAREQKLKDQQTARDLFKVDTPQFAEADQKLLEMTYDYQLYVSISASKMERARKKQIIALFDRITAAVGKVAVNKKLDLVVADVRPELPAQGTQEFEQMNENQIKTLLAQRNVLFSSKAVDITSDVIAQMDADYKGGK